MNGDLVNCNISQRLMEELYVEYKTKQWGLFIDSSKISLKALLLHNGNVETSIPISHARHMKETYLNIQNLLKKYIKKTTTGTFVPP